MKSKVKFLVVLAVTVSLGLVIAACAGSGSESGITEKDLAGLWKFEDSFTSGIFVQFYEDGTYRQATSPVWLEKAPHEIGEFQVDGAMLTLVTSNESRDCAGQSGSYQVELMGQDQLQLALQEDPCPVRANEFEGAWSRFEP